MYFSDEDVVEENNGLNIPRDMDQQKNEILQEIKETEV